VPRAQRRIPRSIEFSEPIVAGSTPRDASRTAKVLNERLDLLCAEFGITSANRNKYRALCLVLLTEVIGLQGFQILDKQTKRGGGRPVVWTLRRHLSLVKFVNGLAGDQRIPKSAFGQAQVKFSAELSAPGLTDGTVRAEYYRAKRFFESAPRIAILMLVAAETSGKGPGARFADFIKDGGEVFTKYGRQAIAPSHIRKAVRASKSPARARVK
jgi:hypothetical protein